MASMVDAVAATTLGVLRRTTSSGLDRVLLVSLLGAIYVLAFSTRLFSVLRFESVIHEFDPYFNFRTTKYLSTEGAYEFHNWFDVRTWYPLGRNVGGTIYPGLMMTASAVYWLLNTLHISVNIRNVCVFLAPWMSGNTAVATFLLGREVMLGQRATVKDAAAAKKQQRKADCVGLLAAALVSIVPGYISRSVAGSYDNEGVAIFALVFTFYLWLRAVHLGSLAWAVGATLSYFYMVAAWGGYVFIINIIPIHVLVLMVSGRYSSRLYVAYSTFYCVGTLLAMQVSFVGFQPVYSSEHLAALATFGLLQLRWLRDYVKAYVADERDFERLQQAIITAAGAVALLAVAVGTLTGYIAPWTGRFYSLLDPTYAKAHIPIIASVSEHQPTAWSSYFFDLHFLAMLTPAGMYFLVRNSNDGKIFLLTYGAFAVYFSGVMVRLMLTLAPAACLLGAVAVTETLYRQAPTLLGVDSSTGTTAVATPAAASAGTGTGTGAGTGKSKAAAAGSNDTRYLREYSLLVVGGITALLGMYAIHSVWVTSEAYSSPSIVLSSRRADGSRAIFDDYREAYWWLRTNTPDDSKVMSWWDYGYQINAMANRTILVDNNTWNNTHIATVGRAMSTTEEEAYPIMRSLDVDYVLVIFGGLTGYSGDDINKFLWMVRIGGGVFPHIKESDYFTKNNEFRVDKAGSPTLLNCLMYKLSYYRFSEMVVSYSEPSGYDRVRNVEIGNKQFDLTYLEEAFTSEHWIVRIYKVKKPDNRVA